MSAAAEYGNIDGAMLTNAQTIGMGASQIVICNKSSRMIAATPRALAASGTPLKRKANDIPQRCAKPHQVIRITKHPNNGDNVALVTFGM